eukprot:1178815-Prymnesium_polylepis.1
MQCTWPQPPQVHTGSGVPHQRLRESAQSHAPRSQLPKRCSPTVDGTHATSALLLTSSSRSADIRTNHESSA